MTSLRWLGHHGNLHGVRLEGEKVLSAPVLPVLPVPCEPALCVGPFAPILKLVSLELRDFIVVIHHRCSC